MDINSKIYIAGHNGMVGSALVRALQNNGYTNLIFKKSSDLDLKNQQEVDSFFNKENPEYVFLAAAKVGGIGANIESPAEFLYDNIMINSNVIHASYRAKVKKLLFLGSSCIYPRLCPQPMREEYLLDGKLEPTNEGYAIGKIVGIKLCEFYQKQYGCNFISVMPPNLYGEYDNFSPDHSHVIAALIRKFHEGKCSDAKEVVIWGTGRAKREFLYVDDAVDALIFLMKNYNDSKHINVGSGKDISIIDLAYLIKDIVGFKGEIVRDTSKKDGMPRKLMDNTRISNLGWQHSTNIDIGIKKAYNWFLNEKI